MRASLLLGLGVAFALATPAFADPAYKANTIVDFFAKAKADKNGKTRGICFEDEATCNKDAAPKRFDLMVSFEFDSDKLTASAKQNLDQFASALRDPTLRGTKFAIDGFTDATGTEVYNKGLSERRAQAVAAYLGQLGVSRDTLIAKGFGPTKPRVADPFDAANRRVETHLVD